MASRLILEAALFFFVVETVGVALVVAELLALEDRVTPYDALMF